MALRDGKRAPCWRPKQALAECIVKTKCFQEKLEIDECLHANDCYLERQNWNLCRLNNTNPRYRIRGNPYDTAPEDAVKVEARNERIMRRMMEEQALDTQWDNIGTGIKVEEAKYDTHSEPSWLTAPNSNHR